MTTLTSILPNLNDRVVAVHPKTGKKVEVTVNKLLKESFHGKTKNSQTISGFTKWEPVKTEPQPKPNSSAPAKFKPGDRVRIVSSGINGTGCVTEKNPDDDPNNAIYRIILDEQNESQLFVETDSDQILLDFQIGDSFAEPEGHRFLMTKTKFNGKKGTILEKTEEDKKSKFLNPFYRIKLDTQEISFLFGKDEFEYLDKENPEVPSLPSPENTSISIIQKQVDFLQFENPNLDTSKLNKDELLKRAVSEHNAIANIEQEEVKLALFKLAHARNAGIYFKSFKTKCFHGEFEKATKDLGVGERIIQMYMQIAQFWNVIEDKAKNIPLLEDSQSQFSVHWALGVIREVKKSFKSAEPTINFNSITEELNAKAKSLGLNNGKSVMPDLRGKDRDRADKLDPTTVNDQPGYYPSSTEYYPPVETEEEEEELAAENFQSLEEIAEDEGVNYPSKVEDVEENHDKTKLVKGTNIPITHVNGLPIRPVGPCEFDSEDDDENHHHEEDDNTIAFCLNEIKESEDPEYVVAGIINALLPKYKTMMQKFGFK